MNLLYIGNPINSITSGADQVNKRNQLLLTEIFHGQITYVYLNGGSFWDKLFLGVNQQMIDVVKRELYKGIYSHVFLSQSLLGRIAKIIKQYYPSVEVINFFHNIEIQYAHEYLKTKGLKALPFYLTAKWWERVGCYYTDKFITLNHRDSLLLKEIYGRTATIELPTSFDDKYDNEKAALIADNIILFPIDYLFVGMAFFANIQGVQWFIDNVMPKVNGHFHIVGKGMDNVSFNNLTPNIHIHGFVDDLADFYYRARMVVSPIFVGGGMKTKTAEALMYGKTIVGTKEAFEGYLLDSRCMYLCAKPEDFVKSISNLEGQQKINSYSRDIYNKYYSTHTALQTLKRLFNE